MTLYQLMWFHGLNSIVLQCGAHSSWRGYRLPCHVPFPACRISNDTDWRLVCTT